MKIRYFLLLLSVVICSISILNHLYENGLKVEKKRELDGIERIISENSIIGSTFKADNLKELQLKSKSACVYDCKSQRILYGKNEDEILPMASTTKIMTCITVLENISDLGKKATVSKYASSMPDVQLNAIKGDSFRIKDLLYSLMLESHNDSAVILAENVAAYIYKEKVAVDNVKKSKHLVELFAKVMNDNVMKMGLKNTCFVTPNGLDAEKHHTTATELAKVAAYAIKNEKFIEITNTINYSFSSKQGRKYMVNNKNRFLTMYPGAIGCKTGYTSRAGYCFVGAIKQKEYELVSVVLGCGWPPNKNYKWEDTKKLMDYVKENYSSRVIKLDNNVIKDCKIRIYKGNKKEICINTCCRQEKLMNMSEQIQYKICIPKRITAPIDKGKKIGVIKYYSNGRMIGYDYIKSDSKVKYVNFREKFVSLCEHYVNL